MQLSREMRVTRKWILQRVFLIGCSRISPVDGFWLDGGKRFEGLLHIYKL
jgi:hypothetical protein